jgi:hypothetical protein
MNLQLRRRQGNFSVSIQEEDSQGGHGEIWKLDYKIAIKKYTLIALLLIFTSYLVRTSAATIYRGIIIFFSFSTYELGGGTR